MFFKYAFPTLNHFVHYFNHIGLKISAASDSDLIWHYHSHPSSCEAKEPFYCLENVRLSFSSSLARLYYTACPITHRSVRRGSNRPENGGQMKINECWLVIRWHLLSCSEPSHLYFWPDQVSPLSTGSGAGRCSCPPAEFDDWWRRLFLGVCVTISSIPLRCKGLTHRIWVRYGWRIG